MSNLGFSVILHMLAGNPSQTTDPDELKGEAIKDIKLVDDILHLEFSPSGRKFEIADNGQSCCESRYMRTDDNLQDYIGATFLGHELRDIDIPKDSPDEYTENAGGDCHEILFFVFKTDRGNITFSIHNEHNGYYGGFSLFCKEVTDNAV